MISSEQLRNLENKEHIYNGITQKRIMQYARDIAVLAPYVDGEKCYAMIQQLAEESGLPYSNIHEVVLSYRVELDRDSGRYM